MLLTKDGRILVRVPLARRAVDIPDFVTTVDKGAFEGCAGLTAIKIPATVSLVDRYAFHDCVSLQEVVFSTRRLVLDDGAFNGCVQLKKVWFPLHMSRLELRYGVFQECASLEHISFPMGLMGVPALTFLGCTRLKTVRLPETILARDADALKEELPQGCELDVLRLNEEREGAAP